MRQAILPMALASVLVAAGPAWAASLAVHVTDQDGRPVEDAVVTLLGAAADAPRREPATATIDQKQLTFLPFVQVLHPGDSVVFRNSDRTRHHVYSFSAAKAFEFVLAPGESSRPLVLEKGGVAAVGCNIHDGMISYLYVTEAPWAARSDARGVAAFDGLRAGTYQVRVWQPRLPPGRPDLLQLRVELGKEDVRTLDVPLKLRADPRQQFDREHTRY